jgi:hypothetical protein
MKNTKQKSKENIGGERQRETKREERREKSLLNLT